MAANGGIKGKLNKPSHGGDAVTTMTASGNFAVQQGTTEVDVLVVAGGGAGGHGNVGGGGGGAGGLQNLTTQSVNSANDIAITVGGGASGAGSNAVSADGSDSVFSNPFNPITSTGGGGGGSTPAPAGRAGGSGGGSYDNGSAGAGTPGQGNNGGGSSGSSPQYYGGGGGGAGSAGVSGATPENRGNGGDGAPSTITGTATYFAGGGSGSVNDSTNPLVAVGGGGKGGGGSDDTNGTSGTTNTGGGGGGGGDTAGSGGSGIVIVKEKDKASGVWNSRSQYSSKLKGQWPDPNQYEITNSCRFARGSTEYLNISRSGHNTKTATFSVWTKMGEVKNFDNILFGGAASSTTRSYVYFSDPNGLAGIFSETSDSTDIAYASNAIFKDPTAWYHVVISIDTTQATAADRFKMYINGEQYTDWATATAPSQNAVIPLLGESAQTVGGGMVGGDAIGAMAEGYMADCYYIDGLALHCGNFGEPDPDNPTIWRPKKYEGIFGSAGFKLEFKQTGTGTAGTGTIGADTSGNLNHLTSNNLDSTSIVEDTPTNNFCTYNPLATPESLGQFGTFTEGNTIYTGHSNGSFGSSATGTFGAASGKWYWESKLTTALSNGIGTGIRDIAEWNPDWANDSTFNHTDGGGDGGYAYNYNNGKPQRNNGESTTNQGSAVSQNDIVMHAMDLDNGALYYGINGTWQASSDPESGASKTNAQHSFTVAGVYAPAAYSYSSRAFATNFGNPSFSISSGNADANGYGNFEYAVPSGYYSLCTKNLAQYG